MARSVDEWVGKNDDTPPPPRVKLRILHRQNFICAISGLPIKAGDRVQYDHIVELILGGKNAESNLQAVLEAPHKEKTKQAMAMKAKADAVAKQAFGLNEGPRRPIESRNDLARSRKPRMPVNEKFANLPRSRLYEDVK